MQGMGADEAVRAHMIAQFSGPDKRYSSWMRQQVTKWPVETSSCFCGCMQAPQACGKDAR